MTKLLKFLTALCFGFLCGFCIYFDLAMIFVREPSALFVFTTFFGGWALTTRWMVRGADKISTVVSRGFLLSAIAFFSLTPAVSIFAAKHVDVSGSGAETAGSLIGGGLAGGMGIALSLTLTFLSLVGFALVKLFARESGAGKAMMECPACAESIRVGAKKCRFCGEIVP